MHITDVNAKHPQCPLGCPVNLSHPQSLSPQEQLRSCEKPGGMGRSLGTRQRFSGTCASDGVDFCFFGGEEEWGTPCWVRSQIHVCFTIVPVGMSEMVVK